MKIQKKDKDTKVVMAYITKTELFDYVTKSEFNEFREEVYSRFTIVERRLDLIEQRLGNLEKSVDNFTRRINKLEEDLRIQMGAYYEKMNHNFQLGMELLKQIATTRA